MATRIVTGVVKRPNGSAWDGGEVRFRLTPDTFRSSPTETYPEDTVRAVADASGLVSATLISGADVVYEVTLPSGDRFGIAVPDGSATTLEALRASYAGSPVAIDTVEAALAGLGVGYRPIYNVRDYGALGDGTVDDAAAINAALNAAKTAGAGVVYCPAGTYRITSFLLVDSGKITVAGAGRDATTIRVADAANIGVIDIRSAAGPCVVRDLTVDGNRATNPTGGHGIRIAGVGHRISDVVVKNTTGYGIGAGQETGSTVQDLTIRNTRVENAGNDGIDFKNRSNTNRNNSLVGVVIDGFDLGALGNKAGIDCRGPVKLTNIEVRGAGSVGGAHVRFRGGDGASDLGAHGSSLSDFVIVGTDAASTYGVYVAARDVHIANGQIEDVAFGLGTIAERTQVSNVTARSCATYGFLPSLTSTALYAVFTGCAGIACGTDGVRVNAASCEFHGCTFRDNGNYGIRLLAGADNGLFVGGDVGNNTTANVTNAAAGTRFERLRGYVTLNKGATSVADGGTIAHGLVAAPTRVSATPSVAGEMASVIAVGATTFTVALKTGAGAAGTTQTVYWEAEV